MRAIKSPKSGWFLEGSRANPVFPVSWLCSQVFFSFYFNLLVFPEKSRWRGCSAGVTLVPLRVSCHEIFTAVSFFLVVFFLSFFLPPSCGSKSPGLSRCFSSSALEWRTGESLTGVSNSRLALRSLPCVQPAGDAQNQIKWSSLNGGNIWTQDQEELMMSWWKGTQV